MRANAVLLWCAALLAQPAWAQAVLPPLPPTSNAAPLTASQLAPPAQTTPLLSPAPLGSPLRAAPVPSAVRPAPLIPARTASPELIALEQRLAAVAASNPGEFGIAALDLASGETVSFNGNEPFPMASTMKVAVAAAYLTEVDAGIRSLDDQIAGVSAATLMEQMITRSDNRATDLLMNRLGGPAAIDSWLRVRGIGGMRVDRTIAQLLSDRRDLKDIRDSSTPAAMLNLLRMLDTQPVLKPESRLRLLDLMARCKTGSNRMRALLPAAVKVEHKTGTLTGYTGDVGFLTLPSGRRLAVAFFARGGSNRPAVIATAARAIFDAFEPGDRSTFAAAAQPGASAESLGGVLLQP
ncbi:serine hydrolase [Sphingosinicella sp. BN140058]|uniref:serine hydrolase n=1 Tax=Sphingosinicella sp. BN140058 TaxID=1892855 RepID=UPI0010134035|nr:serine hydrolase [Sphingosinicella sp. BN140058]QAY78446.1 serine hydrolase [Sphingosinicella sp. BN140058]